MKKSQSTRSHFAHARSCSRALNQVPAPANSVTSLRPICVGYKEVERVGTYKLLGVIISDDLKWNAHVEYIIAKAAEIICT